MPVLPQNRLMTVQLLPFLSHNLPTVIPAKEASTPPALAHRAPSSLKPDISQPLDKLQQPSVVTASKSAEVAVPATASDSPKSALIDPAALVKSYSYENSKSDLQKAIESHGGTVALTKGQYDDFHAQMDFATVPGCLNSDGLKHDPPKIGPIGVGGYLAIPFVVHAAITGKCKVP